MSYYGSIEDIKCKIGVTIWFKLWSYDTIMTGNIYIENGPGRVCNGPSRAGKLVVGNGPGRNGIGPGQIISARADLWPVALSGCHCQDSIEI